MTKLKKKIFEPVFIFNELINFLENKYKFNHRDYLNSNNHFIKWCDKHKLPLIDEKGKERNESNIFFEMYKSAIDGEKKCPEHQDFWHVITEEENIYNGCFFYLGGTFSYNKYPKFVQKIIYLIKKEFPNDYDEEKGIKIWVEW